jgi:hypothetical protein
MFYSGDEEPEPMEVEYMADGGTGMRTSIQVEVYNQNTQIDPKSRINLKALHTCQKNWKVCIIGEIEDDSWDVLWAEHRAALGTAQEQQRTRSSRRRRR